ncbi:hypothetical protein [Roseococcus sp. YIM B11640]
MRRTPRPALPVWAMIAAAALIAAPVLASVPNGLLAENPLLDYRIAAE